MARENVMSTPIFDELLREMAQRAEPKPTAPAKKEPDKATTEQPVPASRRRHRAD